MKQNEMLLSNIDIIDICKYLKLKLVDVVSKDQLIERGLFNGGYIINMEDNDKGNGTHWVLLYVKNRTTVYWDSFGEMPPEQVSEFTHGFENIISYDTIQNIADYSCGFYCIAMLAYLDMNKDENMEDLMLTFNAVFDLDETKRNVKVLQFIFKKIIKQLK